MPCFLILSKEISHQLKQKPSSRRLLLNTGAQRQGLPRLQAVMGAMVPARVTVALLQRRLPIRLMANPATVVMVVAVAEVRAPVLTTRITPCKVEQAVWVVVVAVAGWINPAQPLRRVAIHWVVGAVAVVALPMG